MAEQVGWRGLIERLKAEAPRYSHIFPQLPRLAHQALTVASQRDVETRLLLARLVAEQRHTNRLLSFFAFFVGAFVVGAVAYQVYARVL
jgi:ubiquinone biosynthesis protein